MKTTEATSEATAVTDIDPEVQSIMDEHVAQGKVFAAQMSKYTAMADGHHGSGKWELWLYFNSLSSLQEAAKALQDDGFRRLDGFKSPEGSNQLAYSLIIQTCDHSCDLTRGLDDLMKAVGVNAAHVFNMHDGTLLVSIDRLTDALAWAVFRQFMNQAGGTVREHRSVHEAYDLGITQGFIVDMKGIEKCGK